ncbi:MAG: TIGR04282 family arsenosugar biosynthesis glycosyltransferase [Rubripirellula sp.]
MQTVQPESNEARFHLGMMMKYWRPGDVKTRLAASIGDDQAAQLHRLFVHQLCLSLCHAGDSRSLVFAPPSVEGLLRDELASWGIQDDWSYSVQCSGDLGDRMDHWFRDMGKRSLGGPNKQAEESQAASVILIGADCPTLTQADVEQAARAMSDHDVVLGPAADGGYYLIGMRSHHAVSGQLGDLFRDMPWSTADVLSTTVDRVARAGLKLGLLDQREDIDTVVELNRLRQLLARVDGDSVDERSGEFTATALANRIECILRGESKLQDPLARFGSHSPANHSPANHRLGNKR